MDVTYRTASGLDAASGSERAEARKQFYKDRLDAVMENYQIANEKYSFYSDRVNEVLNRIANQ